MKLKHDSSGFLIGDIVDISKLHDTFQKVAGDVKAIKEAIFGGLKAEQKTTEKAVRTVQKVATPKVGNTQINQIKSLPAMQRDEHGRFVSSKPQQRAVEPRAYGSLSATQLNKVAQLAITGASVVAAGDPTAQAAREVAEPLSRGFGVLFGDEDKKQNKWLSKIFKSLNIFHKEDTTYSKAAKKSLKAIEEKSGYGGGEDGSFSGGAMGSLLGRFLPWALGGIATIGSSITGMLTPVLTAIFSPVGLGIAAAGIAAWGLFTDDGRKFFSEIGSKIAGAWQGAVDWFKQQFPELSKTVSDGYQKAVDATSKAIETTVNTAKEAVTYLEKSSPITMAAIDKVTSAVKGAGNWVLGQTSKMFESGKGGAGTVSSGKGDHGGASYGTYQLSSKAGTLKEFLKQSGYRAQFAGLTPGSKDFNAKWKQLAKDDPRFGEAQHNFIKSTHYDPAMRMLKKGGIDLSSKGAAVQDALWSTSVQFGAGGGSDLIKKALSGKDSASLSDAEIVSAIQDYKLANNSRLFKKSSASVQKSTAARAVAEKAKLMQLTKAPIVASTKAPTVPVAVSAPNISSAPEVREPLNSRSDRPLTVNLPSQDIGQMVSDRAIAHIASGGLGGQ